VIKYKLLCGAKRDLLPADDVAAALWHPLKAFSAPFYGSAQDLFHHAALICACKKFTKTRSAADYFLLLLRHVGHEHQTDAECLHV
jgi:hypothetical protein